MKLTAHPFGSHPFPSDYEVIKVATLNKTDLGGGNNKYYVIEAHAAKDGSKFRLYSRYGRVGADGVQEERIPAQDQASLLDAFESLKAEKTGSRKGYVEVLLAQAKMGSDVARSMVLSDDVKKDKVKTEGKDDSTISIDLHPTVEQLVDRLFAEAGQAVRRQLSGALQTSAENPLGTLTLSQISQGRQFLRDVQKLLVDKPKLKGSVHADIISLSNSFYSAIPQVMSLRPQSREGKDAMESWLGTMALNNEKIIDEKEELLDLLSDVRGVVGGFATTDIGRKYQEIGCEYTPLEKSDKSWKNIETFVQSTRSDRHGWKVGIEHIWRVSVNGQKDKHLPRMKDIGNIVPLFHGSRPCNILGICKHGLLMRPPGVYITGSMFGNGLYFADQSSKSEQYAMGYTGGSGGRGDTFFMFVADVALGKIKKYQNAQTHLMQPPSGYHSVQGEKGSSLYHNEYIIYAVQQHLLQYLIEFRQGGRGY